MAYIIPTWYILNKGTQLFDKSCGGEYEKSLVGRLGKFGDRVSETKLVKNSFVDNLKTYGRTIKNNIQGFVDKHPMLSAMDKTPTKPENSMPKSFMETQSEADIKEASNKLKQFVEKQPKSLKEAGATKAEIEALKSKYGTDFLGRIKNSKAAIEEFQLTKMGGQNIMTTISSREAAIAKQLERYEQFFAGLAKDDPRREIVTKRIKDIKNLKESYRNNTLRNVKLNALGLGKKSFAQIQKEPVKNAKVLEQALEKGKGFLPKLSENYNKLKSIHAPKSALGRLFPKLAKLGMRGLTFGGGTFNTLFIAFTMAGSIKNAVEAPKEQKAGTIAGGLLETLSWVVSMPLALGAMHKVGGIKYTGLSKAQVEKYRNAKKIFDKNVTNGVYKTEAAYNKALNAIENMKKVSTPQGKFTKAMKGIANFLSIGLEQSKPFQKATKGLKGSAKWSARLSNLGKKMPNFLRNCVGYPLRFGLYMFAFAPVVDKLFSGVTSAIFGKPYDPEEIKAEKEKEAARRAQLYPGPRILPLPHAADSVGTTDLNTLSDSNLIKQKITGVKPSNGMYPGTTTTTTVTPNGNTVTTTSNTPFMPPVNQQGNPNPQADPNKSEYDTVPRSYVPTLDLNSPFKYSDPMANPNAEKNYDTAQAIANKADKLADEVEAFINEGKSA